MSELASKKCFVCEVGGLPLSDEDARRLLEQVPNWAISTDRKVLARKWKFADYSKAYDFVSKVSKIAEEEGHHPDIRFGWGYVEISLTTHAVGGLSENDFILAAKIDKLAE
jgi:4a-hydroxytetrahydrobiopterin dehydratase